MSTDDFFELSKEQSVVKATIVAKYFMAWANVIMRTAKTHDGRIGYMDLFAGPGLYEDGTPSTPIRILETAIKDPNLSKMLVTTFNDKNPAFCDSLIKTIDALPDVKSLAYEPAVCNMEVGDQFVQLLKSKHLIPTLFFIDPWGFKGLSLELLSLALRDWGCDCIFFFNYRRINMVLSNQQGVENMDELFGARRAQELRTKISGMSAHERELTVVEAIAEALKDVVGPHVLPFRFKDDKGKRTSHYIIFASKHFRGYEIMKGIMARESTSQEQGVPAFEYCPAKATHPVLFELSRPLDDLEDSLLTQFAGRTLSMKDIYVIHNVGRPYISRNYKDVLGKLKAAGKIRTDPDKLRKGTFADGVKVTFPARGGQ